MILKPLFNLGFGPILDQVWTGFKFFQKKTLIIFGPFVFGTKLTNLNTNPKPKHYKSK
jgi:hypothetical protein